MCVSMRFTSLPPSLDMLCSGDIDDLIVGSKNKAQTSVEIDESMKEVKTIEGPVRSVFTLLSFCVSFFWLRIAC
jgi:hypothetical protein